MTTIFKLEKGEYQMNKQLKTFIVSLCCLMAITANSEAQMTDPLTAVIRLKKPHPALMIALASPMTPILPKHVYGDGQDIRTHPANLKPVGSGPFKFVSYTDKEIVLEKYTDFFLPGRPLDRVFSFEFAALNYHASEKNRYRYKMEGFEEDWTEVDSTRRFATYTGIPSLDAQEKIVIGVDEFSTYLVDMVSKKVLQEAYLRCGVTVEFKKFPMGRALDFADTGKIDGIDDRIAGIEQQYPNLMMIPVPIASADLVVIT
ncbi:MAG: hypothetical protein GY761_06230, partial [Hyphomicrobiales bacterium]|nr:hypothetical protein [Hyphomicrobiales bacterium]